MQKNTKNFGNKHRFIWVLALCLFHFHLDAQNATQASIGGTNTTISINNNVASSVDAGLFLSANGLIDGFTVSITGSYFNGDLLDYTGALPLGVIATPFNTSTHSLVFSGTASAADWQALLRTVTLQTSSAICNPESRQVSFVIGEKYYNPLNQHFYEYNTAGLSWTDAKAYAASRSYFGREGYLGTLGTQGENSFAYVLVGQNSWIGCSDNYLEINGAVGYSLYANQAAADGNFYWITGPDRGVKICSQNGWGPGGFMPVSGIYNNWDAGEPNDWPDMSSGSPGEEDYGHIYAGSGLWNDFPDFNSIGSIIEYGDMPNDNTVSNVVFTRNVYINGAPSGTILGGNVSVCPGINGNTLNLTGLVGTVVQWESSTDNFLTPGIVIPNISTSLNVNNLLSTTYFRAVVNTSNGCMNLATSSTPIYVTSSVAGNIIADNNSICEGSSVHFTLFGHEGSVLRWETSQNSNFSGTVSDINSTESEISVQMDTIGSYYFRAVVQNNGCGTAVYTPAYNVAVVSGTAPVGGTVSSAEHCDATPNAGTLNLAGHFGTIQKWQYSDDNGTVWTDIANTDSSISYAGVTATRQYRALLENGTCGSTLSSIGVVTVYGNTATRWDGGSSDAWQTSANWCGGIADNGIDIVMNASALNDLMLDQDRLVGNINFNGSQHTILLNDYTLTASGFSNQDSFSFIQTNDSGKLKVFVEIGRNVVFPVGYSTFNPLSISNNTAGGDYISVRVFDGVLNNGYNGTSSTAGRVDRTWDIDKETANNGGGLDLVFYWNAGDVFNLSSPALYHFVDGSWDEQSGSTSSGPKYLSFAGYSGTFSPFAIGNALTPLNAELLNFTAEPNDAQHSVALNWTTISETDKSRFGIERSSDGLTWVELGVIEGTENGQFAQSYVYLDQQPESLNYYRIASVDGKGVKTYSSIRTVRFTNELRLVQVYPNPSRGSIELSCTEDATYVILDAFGRTVSSGYASGRSTIEGLAAGIYIIRVSVGEEQYVMNLIVQ